MQFNEFPKVARYSREAIVTEKIDGTNAQIFWDEVVGTEDEYVKQVSGRPLLFALIDGQLAALWAGSRTRYIAPTDDNYGFAKWVVTHASSLAKLGFGRHYGEWWGHGIQRGYGLREKKFSLFNTVRWSDDRDTTKYPDPRPECCDVVPVIARGLFRDSMIESALHVLREQGSVAAPGFMRPEGVMVYHVAGNIMFKKTLDDDGPKSATNG